MIIAPLACSRTRGLVMIWFCYRQRTASAIYWVSNTRSTFSHRCAGGTTSQRRWAQPQMNLCPLFEIVSRFRGRTRAFASAERPNLSSSTARGKRRFKFNDKRQVLDDSITIEQLDIKQRLEILSRNRRFPTVALSKLALTCIFDII